MAAPTFLPLQRRETIEGKQNAAREVLANGVAVGASQAAEGTVSLGLSPACAHYLDIALSEKVWLPILFYLRSSVRAKCPIRKKTVTQQEKKKDAYTKGNITDWGAERLGQGARHESHQHHHPR